MGKKPVLYTTHCPMCLGLEKKLKDSNIEYEECSDIDLMMQKGITRAPMLEVNEEMMDYKNALKWINGRTQ